ncbi:hypothetical protein MRX96_033781 [Rhipicephalus microplus]
MKSTSIPFKDTPLQRPQNKKPACACIVAYERAARVSAAMSQGIRRNPEAANAYRPSEGRLLSPMTRLSCWRPCRRNSEPRRRVLLSTLALALVSSRCRHYRPTIAGLTSAVYH